MDQLLPMIFLLVNQKSGLFYSLTNLDDQLSMIEEINDDLPRQTKSASWKGLADDKVARHIEQHVFDHFKRVVERLHSLTYKSNPEFSNASIILGGPEETLNKFSELLSAPLKDKIIGMIHPDRKAGIKELDEQVKIVLADAADKRTQAVMAQIENNRQPDGRGVVGQEAVYEALNLKQVQILLIDLTTQYSGFVCSKDNNLSISFETCPACLGPMTKKEDLSVLIRESALKQQAKVIEVTDKSIFPTDAESLAAVKRFPG